MAKKKATKDPGPSEADLAHILPALRPLATPLDQLLADPRNARRHPERNLAATQASLARFGQRKNVVARRQPDGTLLLEAGHGTCAAARALGWRFVAAVVLEEGEPEARAYGLADNRTAELAEWDEDVLRGTLLDLRTAEFRLDELGWSPSELEEALGEQPLAPDPGAPDPPPHTQSRAGELFELGPHRLLCGDSTKPEDVSLAAGTLRASLVATDPPYGIDYVGGYREACVSGKCKCHPGGVLATMRRRKLRLDGKRVANDALGEAGTRELLRGALQAAPCAPGAACYVASPANAMLQVILSGFEGTGFEFKHSLAWVKDVLVLGRCDYHYRHELILYGWRTDAGHYFTDDRTQDSVLEIPRPKRSPEHPTMKPVELYERLVRNSTRPGEVVYDPFGGSGTTLLACARLERRAVLVELDPGYCDVIRRRWTAWADAAGVDAGSGALR